MRARRAALVAGMVVLGLASGGLATAAQPPAVQVPAPAGSVAPTFSDIGPGDVFYDDVAWMASANITTGWPDGTFRPLAPVTREAFAAFLARWVFGTDLEPCDAADERVFSDVEYWNPFCSAIEWLAGFAVDGYPDGTFRPSAPITREAVAAILMRGYPGTSPTCDAGPRAFTDVASWHPFCGYIEMAADWGIVNGWSDGTFRPGLLIERQAFAAMLHRMEIRESTATLQGAWADAG